MLRQPSRAVASLRASHNAHSETSQDLEPPSRSMAVTASRMHHVILLVLASSVSSSVAGGFVERADGTSVSWARRNKLYLYTWCGLHPDNPGAGNDYVATIDASPLSPTFGQVVNVADSPYKGTQAHHINVDATGKWLGAGGLVSFLGGAPDIMLFNVKDAAEPVYSHEFTAQQGACTDEFVALAQGGFAITNMCNRSGNAGGGIAVLDRKMRNIVEYSGNIADPTDASTFNPHGIDIDFGTNRAVTCDFVEIASLVKDADGNASPKFRTTVRIWDWENKQVIKTIDVGHAQGLMDVRYVPNSQGLFLTSNGLGQLLLIDAVAGMAAPKPAYCLAPDCSDIFGVCITSKPFAGGTRMLVASYATNDTRLLDITDPRNLVELDRYTMAWGGHVVKYHEPTGIAAVSTYFVDQPGTVVRMGSDQRIYLLQVTSANGGSYNKLEFLKYADFKTAVPEKGSSNCHGVAFNRG